MRIAYVVGALILGSVLFHFLSPWYFLPLASNWSSIDLAISITFWVTGAVFVIINGFMVYCLVKYRNREGVTAHYEPENAKLEKTLTTWTAVGIVALLAPGLYAWSEFVNIPEDADVVEAVGQQWSWTYRFPGDDGVLGATEIRYIGPTNPFGINPDDPYGRDDILVQDNNTVHLPVDRTFKVVTRSKDVLHDFYVPQFRARMNLVPGLVSYFWFTPTTVGSFEILCAQLCGTGHYGMRGVVVVEEEAAFENWLSEQPTFASTVASN